jgi:hypothetical protein
MSESNMNKHVQCNDVHTCVYCTMAYINMLRKNGDLSNKLFFARSEYVIHHDTTTEQERQAWQHLYNNMKGGG